MRDDYQLEEVSGAVGLGLLAGDIVIATSKLLRGADLSTSDRAALVACEALLKAMASPPSALLPGHRLGQLGSKRSAIDALRAVQLRVPPEDVQAYVKSLADAVASVLKEVAVTEHAPDIESVRDLFSQLGEVEVSRVTAASRPMPEVPDWLTSTASLRS